MFKSIIDRLTGKPKTDPDDWTQDLALLFQPLDSLENGLSQRAILYMLTGEDRPVLNALDAHPNALRAVIYRLEHTYHQAIARNNANRPPRPQEASVNHLFQRGRVGKERSGIPCAHHRDRRQNLLGTQLEDEHLRAERAPRAADQLLPFQQGYLGGQL